MIILYHHSMLAPSRRIRLLLAEKEHDFQLQSQNFWERDESFLKLNPSGGLPVLVDEEGIAICGATPIAEYLEEMYESPMELVAGKIKDQNSLNGFGAIERAEVRRIVDWFDHKFHDEVIDYIVGEKIYKRLGRQGEPDPSILRAGGQNLTTHMRYLEFLLMRREWLTGSRMTIADLAAAAALSLLDYLGEVPWNKHLSVKNWYTNIKHRPSFRPLLKDRLAGFPPQRDYTNLDF